MKKLKLIIITIFFLIIFDLVHMRHYAIIDNGNNGPKGYYFRINEKDDINRVLSRKKYYYTTELNKEYIAVIIYQDGIALMKQFLTGSGNEFKLEIPYGSRIAISLLANSAIFSEWNIKNKNDIGMLQLYDNSQIRNK